MKIHSSGLIKYKHNGKWKFAVSGFGPQSSGEDGYVFMAGTNSAGAFCKVYAKITKHNTVIYKGLKITQKNWFH